MRLSTLQKSGGVSLILGSVLLLAYSILFPLLLPMDEMTTNYASFVLNPNYTWIIVVALVGVLMMIFGIAAVYTRLFSSSGWIGLLGFIFVEVAYIFQACKITWEIFLWPVIASNQASLFLLRDFVIKNSSSVAVSRWIASITIFVGIILFCIALIRSKKFPKLGGILLFIGAMMYGLGPVLSFAVALIGIFIHSIGCTVIGLRLMKKQAGI